MHPVQAAPRQSMYRGVDAVMNARCTPCRQRRGKAVIAESTVTSAGCTPCRQRRGKDRLTQQHLFPARAMHPVQAAPRQSAAVCHAGQAPERCTPCRQRRGKARCFRSQIYRCRCTPCRQRRGKVDLRLELAASVLMHPVQAAPRQSFSISKPNCAISMHPVQAAPRQSGR